MSNSTTVLIIFDLFYVQFLYYEAAANNIFKGFVGNRFGRTSRSNPQ